MINFLGIGSAFNTQLGNNSAYIKKDKCFILFDCGSTVFGRLRSLNLIDDVSELYIIITHTHPDHIGSLGELVFYSHYIRNIKPKILFPEKNFIDTILGSMGVKSDYYEVLSSQNTIINNNDFCMEISFHKCTHVDLIPSYGFIFKFDGSTLYYSGDSNSIDNFVLEGLEKGTIHFLYQDTCGIDYNENPHFYLGRLAKMIKPELRHKVYCMHIDPKFARDEALKLGFNVVEAVINPKSMP
ncbi:MBL fold metallo-hydrolase [Acetivibrio mesophilus]|uniref:Ribonuclease Z n=1 Tax=Acetivibrio mesophilus TaxID=2487273 RepID=A0A4Q0I6W2_9FIRM|nr:MBL fold metallo-hydrolase [Acetivibrio mesophilus]ODM25325.1 MBL fold metallo-hydrolase [Clostridium sp. Bc-iso-3]RXE59657.1 ribonuclease Z [Acetivibrio mesophilus]HHV28625.1 ribonuclease Z [Clostridium sp.]